MRAYALLPILATLIAVPALAQQTSTCSWDGPGYDGMHSGANWVCQSNPGVDWSAFVYQRQVAPYVSPSPRERFQDLGPAIDSAQNQRAIEQKDEELRIMRERLEFDREQANRASMNRTLCRLSKEHGLTTADVCGPE